MDSSSQRKHYSILFPGASPVLSWHPLIDRNHKEHDIFLTKGGKHNHFIHQYLAAYSLGASMEKLQSIYDGHASILIPIVSDGQDITEETYRKEIGNRDAYGSYLKFFEGEVEKHGMLHAIRYWIFKDDMLARTLAGAYHPLIHIGYAIEFDLPSVAAEGLAMAACTEDVLVPVIDLNEQSMREKHYRGTSTIQELVRDIKTDATFDGIIDDLKVIDRLPLILGNPNAASKLREYLADWKFIDPESSLQELFTSCVLIYGASGIREQGIKFSFFLVHALTSVHALYTILPQLNPVQAELLLRGHLVETLTCYISQGRPTLRIDLLRQYESPQKPEDANPWMDVINRTLSVNECHITKAIRALALGQVIYRDSLEDLWIKVAQMTVDVIGPTTESHLKANWDFAGVGFDEAWQE
ncbi:hypothetical protein BJV82DRAFT_205259 [Fennellomyces sp. T-0311]|nr:hypothetical protein BJV82DRAFT_205259 [Fennellomyces sp. T-0311]